MVASRRFATTGIGDEVISTRFDVRAMMRLASRTGQSFGPAFREALATTNEKVAIKIQEGMVEALRRRIEATGRNQRGGETLELALRDERNREVTASNFTVLRPSWMDRSHAVKYWRQIEYGNTKEYQGYIVFSNNGGQVAGPWREGGKRALFGYSRSEPPAGYKHSNLHFTGAGHGGWSSSIGPFPAYHYSEGGKQVFDNTSMRAEYTRALDVVGIKFADVSRIK